jgi:catechol 2,3-dioxygenase-like lactoylglutathione lyase family enzyme
MTTVRGIAEIVLSVHSLAEAVKFYHGILGLPAMTPTDAGTPVFLKAGEGGAVPQMLVLVPLPAGAADFDVPRTLHHLALEVAPERFDAEQARLESLGFSVRSGKHPVIPSRTMYVNDPDGNEVELICPA